MRDTRLIGGFHEWAKEHGWVWAMESPLVMREDVERRYRFYHRWSRYRTYITPMGDIVEVEYYGPGTRTIQRIERR